MPNRAKDDVAATDIDLWAKEKGSHVKKADCRRVMDAFAVAMRLGTGTYEVWSREGVRLFVINIPIHRLAH